MDMFFYGTLCHPSVLERVTGSTGHEYIPAVLRCHTRLRVKGADYPGVIPTQDEEAYVEGMLVTGLLASQINRLDLFEGDEYSREEVQVANISDNAPRHCQTYIFKDSAKLSHEQWDFQTFVKDKLRFWTGEMGEQEYSMLGDGTGGRSSFV